MLSKKERNKVYRALLDEMLNDHSYIEEGLLYVGFCYYVSHFTIYQLEDLPEIYEAKPKRLKSYMNPSGKSEGGYWFNPFTEEGTTIRFLILHEAIEKTK